MSGEATGFVWKHSPYQGATLLVHLAIGDVVNDLHDNQFWMSTEALAKKAKMSRSTVTEALRELVESGYLEVLEAGGATRKPSRYRFLFASAVSDATRPLSDSTSAVSGHERKELKEIPKGASALSGLEPDSGCVRCRGEGILRDAGFERPCSCCDVRPFVEIEQLVSQEGK